MLKLKYLSAGVAVLAICLFATASPAVLQLIERDFAGKYLLYGGYPDELVAPVAGDNKIAFEVRGEAAKDLFDMIGPDQKDACPTQQLRQRDRLLCIYSKQHGYQCHFGFDLSTGLSIGGLAKPLLCH